MEDELLETYSRLLARTCQNPIAAAILTLALTLSPQKKRTGLTTEEAAKYLGVGRCTIIKLCKEGRLRRQQFGKRSVRFNVNDLDAVRSSRPKAGANDPHERHFL